MKKLRTILITLIAMATITAFTSCDDDMSRAITLSGEWEGDFGMYYEYAYHDRVYRFDSYDTRIVFYPDHDYATYGYGKQVDYYEYGPYAYQHYRFRWHIDRGDLFLEYPYDPSLNTVIHDYHMYSDRFYGYFGTSNTKFYLHKLADYYDWGNYSGDYYYDPRGNWYDYYPYFVKREVTDGDTITRAESMGNDTTTVTEGVIRRGNRLNATNCL